MCDQKRMVPLIKKISYIGKMHLITLLLVSIILQSLQFGEISGLFILLQRLVHNLLCLPVGIFTHSPNGQIFTITNLLTTPGVRKRNRLCMGVQSRTGDAPGSARFPTPQKNLMVGHGQ